MLKAIARDPRKERCIIGIYEQVRACERSNIKQRFDTERFQMIIRESAKLYAKLWLKNQEERLMSEAEKIRQIFNADNIKRAEEAMIDLQDEATTKKLTSRPGDIAR